MGDIYEMNFCQEFYDENANIDPWETYKRLNAFSPAPFSCFLKMEDHFLISSSPERFIRKERKMIYSQPIKGTAKRGKTADADKSIKNELVQNKKEIAENIMIVDLVRNDLSKVAKKGSVKVEELCEPYSFPQVHQLISTIAAEAKENINPTDILKACFPMGSMTGAPKIRAMKLIEKYEITKRGLFSGSVGYIDPDGNFDFNVVIRSILYNQKNQYLSFITGGAITALSEANSEYDECLLKANAMKKVLQ